MAIEPTDLTRRRDAHGTSTVRPVETEERKRNWLPWILGALALLLLLLAISRCGRDEVATTETSTTTTTAQTGTAVAASGATTAGVNASGETAAAGAPAGAAADTTDVIGQMRTYVASSEAAGRRFTFDNIHFATSSSALRADAEPIIAGLAELLAAHPNTRLRIEGYADARGGADANRNLGAARAKSVADALLAKGVDAARIATSTGGETNPVDTNATASGQAENRRTDVVVTAK